MRKKRGFQSEKENINWLFLFLLLLCTFLVIVAVSKIEVTEKIDNCMEDYSYEYCITVVR